MLWTVTVAFVGTLFLLGVCIGVLQLVTIIVLCVIFLLLVAALVALFGKVLGLLLYYAASLAIVLVVFKLENRPVQPRHRRRRSF